MSLYKGKEVCQGCNLPGIIKPRTTKDRLCTDCNNLLKAGKSISEEEKIKYLNVFQHYFAFRSNVINEALHDLLKSIHNPYAKVEGSGSIKEAWGTNGMFYKIDLRLFLPIKNLFGILDSQHESLEKDRKLLVDDGKFALAKEKERIFNEGVTYGRNLLIQLNAGEITLKDLDRHVSYQDSPSTSKQG